MIGYLQIQNFIINDKDRKITNVLFNDFKNYCKNKNLKILNPLLDKFHNGVFNDKKAQAIYIFNEYLKNDKRMINLFNQSYSCTPQFYKALKSNKEVSNFINLNFDNIYNYLNEKNIFLANNFYKLKNNRNYISNTFHPYLSFIEEYIINNDNYFYTYRILKIEEIYENFIDYLEKEFSKDSDYALDKMYISEIKNIKDIKQKYLTLLFYDNIIDNLFSIFNEEDNSVVLFHKLKNKYFKRFILEKYSSLDLNLIKNYNKSELFNNNMIIYLSLN